ncbi:hypothetical protein AB6C93_21015 [Vibrio splendidus]
MNEDILNNLNQNIDVGPQVINALQCFIENDSYLLRVNANERSLTHRIGMYLQAEFSNYHVDCEYNRDDHEPKELYIGTEDTDVYDDNAMTVYPDIIVHRRGSNDHNLLVIEFKKTSSKVNSNKDIVKLNAYKRDLNYTHALFIELGTTHPFDSSVTEVRWI